MCVVIRNSNGEDNKHIESQRGNIWPNYSIKYTNFSVLTVLLKYRQFGGEQSHAVNEMEPKLGLKKGEIRECGESDRKILTQRLILMFHRTPHWQSSHHLLLPSDCLGKRKQPAWLWRPAVPS